MWGRGMRVFDRDGWLSTAATSTLLASLYNFDPSDVAGVTSDRYTDGIDRFVDAHVPAGVRHAVRSYLGQFAGAGIAGNHPSDISLSGLAAYEGEESGHNSVLVGGYRTLVDRLAGGVEIVLGSPVTDIRHTASEVSVSGPDFDIGARWAIVTVPLGVLRSGSPTFEPDLPARHRDAISRLGFKQLEKVVFTFEEQFWDDDLTEIVLLDDRHGFISVRDLTGPSGVPTLVCFSNPTIATEPLVRDHTLDAWHELLGRVFGEVPDPRSTTMTNWADDPYSLGSYSYLPVGASVDDMHTLAEPVGPRVGLAGEHTVSAYYGTVQAAWLSGRRAASHVVEGRA
jgi:monoamine oxidase